MYDHIPRRTYTRPVIEACRFVDQFVDLDEISKPGVQVTGEKGQKGVPAIPVKGPGNLVQSLADLKADVIIHAFPVKDICKAARDAFIPQRIATSHRTFTWFTCNRLLHFSRKNSALHEAQLNLKLLQPLGITREFDLDEIKKYFGLKSGLADGRMGGLEKKFNLILHPKSKGSAHEWGLENFGKLIDMLPPDRFNILITGTRRREHQCTIFLMPTVTGLPT